MLSLISTLACMLYLVKYGESISMPKPVIGAYFPNWAQYRPEPATFTPEQMKPIVSTLNVIWYGFAYFCPPEDAVQPYWITDLDLCEGKEPYDVISIEPKDPDFYKEIVEFKEENKELKVLISIGGWNFPSNFWSTMAKESDSRSKFINSVKEFMEEYKFDGVDIDWEYPASPARTDQVKISNEKFYEVEDEGGCDQDGDNLLTLLKEMRQEFSDKYLITIASQADMEKAADEHIKDLFEYIDMYNLMSYDYTVSDIEDSPVTAPNEPLYPPPASTGIWNDSVSVTINGYLAAGIPPEKISVGVSYYGHLWYAPGLKSQDEWCQYGIKATHQGECCGPMTATMGAKYGKYSQLCGTYMYSEIMDAGFEVCFNNQTFSEIGYAVNPKDDYTAEGVWIAFQGEDTVKAIVNFAISKKLGGAFAFDISMDSMDGEEFTYELTKEIAELEKKTKKQDTYKHTYRR